MKRSFIFFLLMLCCIVLNAQGLKRTLVFEMKNGSMVSYLLEEQPQLCFSDENIIVKTQDCMAKHPCQDVQRYFFLTNNGQDEDPTDVDNLLKGTMVRYGNTIQINGLKEGTIVYVFSTDGKPLISDIARNNSATFSVATLPSGVYLIKYSGVTVKITKQ